MNKLLISLVFQLCLIYTTKANRIKIEYYQPEATKVTMIWGINDWKEVDRKPSGTYIRDGIMYSPMAKNGDYFVLSISVPDKATVDYGFNFQTFEGPLKLVVDYWDCNNQPEKKYYHITPSTNSTVRIVPDLKFVRPAREIKFLNFALACFLFFLVPGLMVYFIKVRCFRSAFGPVCLPFFYVSVIFTSAFFFDPVKVRSYQSNYSHSYLSISFSSAVA